jgi:hypothetical protein
LSLTGYIQYFADLTCINNDMREDSGAKPDGANGNGDSDIPEHKWRDNSLPVRSSGWRLKAYGKGPFLQYAAKVKAPIAIVAVIAYAIISNE